MELNVWKKIVSIGLVSSSFIVDIENSPSGRENRAGGRVFC
jgi:hypothetical protein